MANSIWLAKEGKFAPSVAVVRHLPSLSPLCPQLTYAKENRIRRCCSNSFWEVMAFVLMELDQASCAHMCHHRCNSLGGSNPDAVRICDLPQKIGALSRAHLPGVARPPWLWSQQNKMGGLFCWLTPCILSGHPLTVCCTSNLPASVTAVDLSTMSVWVCVCVCVGGIPETACYNIFWWHMVDLL